MQRGAHFFEKQTFPCSVALKVLGVTFFRVPKVLAGPNGMLDSAFPIWPIRMQKSVPMQRGARVPFRRSTPMLRGARFRDVRLDGEEGEAGWVGFRVRGSQVVMPLARLARFARRYVLDKALCSSRALRAI